MNKFKKILFYSSNKGKLEEIKNLINNKSIEILTIKDISTKSEIKETGNTFAENAKLKSLHGYRISQYPCFADDSGICIDALDGKPGVFSKRFIESFKNKETCFKHIIKTVKNKNNNQAFFQTSICLTLAINKHIIFEGRVKGKISDSFLGCRGFGYDPIFIPDGQKKTFSQMSTKNKNLISHRSIAINKLLSFLVN